MKNTLSFHIIKTEHPAETFKMRRQLAMLPAGGLMLAGICLLLLQMGQMEDRMPLFWGMLLISCAVMAALSLIDLASTRMRTGLGVAVAAYVVIGIALHGVLMKGVAAWMNGLQEWLYLQDGIYRTPFANAGSVLPVMIWAAIALGLVAGWLLRIHVWPVYTALLLIVLVFAGIGRIGMVPALLLTLGLMLAMVEVWMDYKNAMIQTVPVLAVLLAASVAVVLLGSSLNGSLGSNLGTTISKALHHMRYEDSEMAMPEGQLNGLEAYQPSDEDALEVTMEHWQALYLKGFTGGEYTGTSWTELTPEELSEEKELLYSLQKDYFYPMTQFGAAYDAVTSVDFDDTANTVTVRNTGACKKYAYVPYGLTGEQELPLQDSYVQTEGLGEDAAQAETEDAVTFTVLDAQNSYLLQKELAAETSADGDQTEEVQICTAAESSYRSFVYTHYLSVPDALQELFEEEELLPVADQTLSTTDAKYWINEMLSRYLTYDENTTTGSTNSDVLKSLVKVEKKGYCVQYASLATMMMRSMGIPARYVEGYLVTGAQADNMEDGDTLHLSQYNAHAWVEYYLDGIGWLVYDPTPGFTDELNYELPVSDETDTENEGYAALQLSDQLENAGSQTEIETEDTDMSAAESAQASGGGRILKTVLVILILLVLAALVIRTILLRSRLKKRLNGEDQADPRPGSAIWLAYTMELLKFSGLPGNIRFLSEYEEQLAAFLNDRAQTEQMIRISERVWFSGREITEAEKEEAKACSRFAMTVWKEKVSLPKRLLHRFWLCKVL